MRLKDYGWTVPNKELWERMLKNPGWSVNLQLHQAYIGWVNRCDWPGADAGGVYLTIANKDTPIQYRIDGTHHTYPEWLEALGKILHATEPSPPTPQTRQAMNLTMSVK